MTTDLAEALTLPPQTFRAAFRRHAAGVVVITADAGHGPVGMTATSLASISLEPALVSFAVATKASAWSTLAVADSVAVHLLSHAQADLARRFATPGIDRFAAPTQWARLADNVPVLTDAATVLHCIIRDRLEAGDHRVVIAEVIDVISRDIVAPLVYHDGDYRTLDRIPEGSSSRAVWPAPATSPPLSVAADRSPRASAPRIFPAPSADRSRTPRGDAASPHAKDPHVFTRTARLATTLATLASLLPLSACAQSVATHDVAATAQNNTVRYQGSAGQVTLPELAESLGLLGSVKLKWVGNTTSGPQDIQSVATDQTDVGGAFNAAIAKLVAAGAPLTSVVGYYGSDAKSFIGYYVLADSPIQSARDLIGKKVAVNTLSAHNEAALDAWLTKGGLTPDDIKQVTLVVIPPVNAEQAVRAHQVDVAALNGILQDKAVAAGGVRRLFADTDLFGAFTAGSYVFRNNFIAANPDTVRQFTTGIAKAIEWERATPREQVIAKFQDIVARRGRTEDGSALQFWKSSGVVSTGGQLTAEDFSRWIDWLVQHGDAKPNQIDAKTLFTNRFNPYAVGASASPSPAPTTPTAKG